MTKHIQSQLRWKSALAVFLAFLMAFALCFAAACSEKPTDEDDDDETTTEATDEQIIKNGNFEFGTSGKDVTFPVYTGINWTRSKDSISGEEADTSDITSGIIDTTSEKFDAIEEEKRPHTNPGVHAGAKEGETKVLMISNKSAKEDANRATAQKFTSTTTLSLEQNSYVKVSFWVLTQGLEKDDSGKDKGLTDRDGNPGDKTQNSEFGANVSVIGTLGSVSQVTVKLSNINTYGEWKQFFFYVNASDYTSSSVQIAAGLGSASATVVENAVAGRAFFDDFTYEVVDEETFDEATSQDGDVLTDVSKEDPDQAGEFVIRDGVAENRAQDAYSEESIVFDMGSACKEGATKNAAAYRFVRTETSAPVTDLAAVGSDFATKDETGLSAPDLAANRGLQGISTYAALKANTDEKIQSRFADAFAGAVPFDPSASAVYIGINAPSSFTVRLSNVFNVGPQEHGMFSFWVKTSEIRNGGKAPVTVQLIDMGPDGTEQSQYLYGTSFTGIDTTPDEDAEEDETKPDFNGWKRYTFFLTNNYTSGDRRFTLRFSYGPTSIANVEEPALDYALPGYAMFAGFETSSLTEEEYDAATTGDYAKKTALYAGYKVDSNDTAFDSAQSSEGDAYKLRPVAPKNYTGVTANHSMVNGGTNTDYKGSGVEAGLVHADYVGDYEGFDDAPWVSDPDFFRNTSKSTLMIRTEDKSYGYLGASATVAANSFATVSVRVRTSGNAKASIYLADLSKERTKRDGETEDNGGYLSPMKFWIPESRENLYAGTSKEYSFTEIQSADGWTTYTFYIATGDFAKTYRLELWNGKRDTEAATGGYVFFDLDGTAVQSTSSETDFKGAMDALDLGDSEIKFTQFPLSDDDKTTYKEGTVYAEAKENATVINSKFFDLRTAEKTDALEEEEEEEEEDSGSLGEVDDPSVWLLVSSLLIAVALIVTIILLLVRKAADKRKKKYVSVRRGYNPNSRSKVKRTSEFEEGDREEKTFEGEEEEEPLPEEEPADKEAETESQAAEEEPSEEQSDKTDE